MSIAALMLKKSSTYFNLFETGLNELRSFLEQLITQQAQPFSFDLMTQMSAKLNEDIQASFGLSPDAFIEQTKKFGDDLSVFTSGDVAQIMLRIQKIAQFGDDNIPKYIDLLRRVRSTISPLSLLSVSDFIKTNFDLMARFYNGLHACQVVCSGINCKDALSSYTPAGDLKSQCNAIVGDMGCLVFDIIPVEEFRCPLLKALQPVIDSRQRLEAIMQQARTSIEGIVNELNSPTFRNNLAKIKQKLESIGDMPRRIEFAAGLMRQFNM